LGELIVSDDVYQKLPPPVTGFDSVKISAKKAFREWAISSALAGLVVLLSFANDPAVIAPLVAKYAPALPAILVAQLISGISRIVVDQYRHGLVKK
jgi:hypothetical protein